MVEADFEEAELCFLRMYGRCIGRITWRTQPRPQLRTEHIHDYVLRGFTGHLSSIVLCAIMTVFHPMLAKNGVFDYDNEWWLQVCMQTIYIKGIK